MISPTTSLIYFSILTISYFLLNYYICGKYDVRKNSSLGVILITCYLAIMLIIQLRANMHNIREKCGGTPQTLSAINYTVLPNLFIFGTLLMVMMFFPGWKAPFSNTLGYMFVYLLNVKTIFINMLKKPDNNKLLQMVYKDPSMMINEITPENFDLFINRMGGESGGVEKIVEEIPSAPPLDQKGGKRKRKYNIQKGGANVNILNNDYKKYIPQLYNLVVIKDRVAEFLWYILTGALVISNSHSYVMTIKCQRTADELSAKLDKKLSKDKKQSKKDAKGKPKWTLGY